MIAGGSSRSEVVGPLRHWREPSPAMMWSSSRPRGLASAAAYAPTMYPPPHYIGKMPYPRMKARGARGPADALAICRQLQRSASGPGARLWQHPVRRLVAVDEGADIDDHRLAHLDPRLERRRGHVRRSAPPGASRASSSSRGLMPLRLSNTSSAAPASRPASIAAIIASSSTSSGPATLDHERVGLHPRRCGPASRMWWVSRVSGVCSERISTASDHARPDLVKTAPSFSSSCGGRRLREK